MKNVVLLFFMLISFYGYSQYPIKTVFKGDSVVIMTNDQFEGLDLMVNNQRSRNDKYKLQIELLEKRIDYLESIQNESDNIQKIQSKTIDSLVVVTKTDSVTRDSIQTKLLKVEHWIMETSIDNAYLYYDWSDSTIKCVDLSLYAFWGNKHTGKIVLFRRSGSIKEPDLAFWKQVNRDYPQIFEPKWTTYYRDKRKPVIINYPYKVVTPYKPQEVIVIRLNDQGFYLLSDPKDQPGILNPEKKSLTRRFQYQKNNAIK
jgi:hypothetical protein